MLTDSDISAMRETAEQALPGTAVIQTRSYTDNAGGGGTVTWTAAGTADCRIAVLRGDEREIAERIAEDSSHIVTLPHSATVTVQNRFVISGGTFNVTGIRDRSWEITQRVEVAKVV